MRTLLCLLIVALAPACRSVVLPPGDSLSGAPVDESRLDLNTLAASLPPPPIAVGFDVDDTLLFSSPGFHYGNTNAEGPGGTNRYGPKPLDNPAFWTDLDRSHDAYSMPKAAARALVAMHAERGDAIYAVTARPGPTGPGSSDADPQPLDDELTERLEAWFDVKLAGPVAFTAHGSKVGALRERSIVLFYGDSDGDMEDAIAAGARPIRLLRSAISTHPTPPNPGAFGESVLTHSDR